MSITLKSCIESLLWFALFDVTIWLFLLVGGVDNLSLHVWWHLATIAFGSLLGYLTRRYDAGFGCGVVAIVCTAATALAGIDYLLASFPITIGALCVSQLLRGDDAFESPCRQHRGSRMNRWDI
jgi:hypothetical protein